MDRQRVARELVKIAKSLVAQGRSRIVVYDVYYEIEKGITGLKKMANRSRVSVDVLVEELRQEGLLNQVNRSWFVVGYLTESDVEYLDFSGKSVRGLNVINKEGGNWYVVKGVKGTKIGNSVIVNGDELV